MQATKNQQFIGSHLVLSKILKLCNQSVIKNEKTKHSTI